VAPAAAALQGALVARGAVTVYRPQPTQPALTPTPAYIARSKSTNRTGPPLRVPLRLRVRLLHPLELWEGDVASGRQCHLHLKAVPLLPLAPLVLPLGVLEHLPHQLLLFGHHRLMWCWQEQRGRMRPRPGTPARTGRVGRTHGVRSHGSWYVHNELVHHKPAPAMEASVSFLQNYLDSLVGIKMNTNVDPAKGKTVVSYDRTHVNVITPRPATTDLVNLEPACARMDETKY
jgi:hypothetical protein